MKAGVAKYGRIRKSASDESVIENISGLFFRKGKAGSWKDEMPEYYRDLFWNYHGPMMERLGYADLNGIVAQSPALDHRVMKLMGMDVAPLPARQKHVLIECSKLMESGKDGVRRYLMHLLKGFEDVKKFGSPEWKFELLIGNRTFPLEVYPEVIDVFDPGLESFDEQLHPYEKKLMALKDVITAALPPRLYNLLARYYRSSGIRTVLRQIRERATINDQLDNMKSAIDTADIVHVPLPQNCVHIKSNYKNLVVTVHDMTHRLFPQFHVKSNVDLCERGMRLVEKRCAAVISISDSTGEDIRRMTGIDHERIHRIYQSADPHLFRKNISEVQGRIIREKYDLGEQPYLLCLSTIEPRKNLANTIAAFHLLKERYGLMDATLVIAGNPGWKSDELNPGEFRDRPDIRFAGFIPDEDLGLIYSEAVALCYVSYYEGFGLPPLEAMSCATPVIYGRNSSMIEVIGDAGLAAEPGDPEEIMEQMYRILEEPGLRDSLSVKAYRRSFAFSRRNSIYNTLKVYESILDGRA